MTSSARRLARIGLSGFAVTAGLLLGPAAAFADTTTTTTTAPTTTTTLGSTTTTTIAPSSGGSSSGTTTSVPQPPPIGGTCSNGGTPIPGEGGGFGHCTTTTLPPKVIPVLCPGFLIARISPNSPCEALPATAPAVTKPAVVARPAVVHATPPRSTTHVAQTATAASPVRIDTATAPAPASAIPVGQGVLAFTGRPVGGEAAAGGILVGLGSFLVWMSGRRRTATGSSRPSD